MRIGVLGRKIVDWGDSMLHLRPAVLADARFVWVCRNDPAARVASTHPAPIPYPDHLQWFRAALDAPDHRLWIAETVELTAVGYGRLDGTAISVAVHPVCRRRGFGQTIIRLISQEAQGSVRAHIKPENLASQLAFAACGYRPTGIIDQSCEVWTYDP